MTLVHIDVSKLASFAASGKRSLELGPGRIAGYLSLSPYVHPNYDPSAGLTLVEFEFKDQNGVGHRYTAIASPLAFWPDANTPVYLGEPPDTWDHEFDTIIDDRDDFELLFADGHVARDRWKYTPLKCLISIRESYLDVFAKVLCVDDRSVDDFLSIVYRLPIANLLWRRAPKIYKDDLEIERQEYVQVDEITCLRGDVPASPVVFRKVSTTASPKSESAPRTTGRRKRWPVRVAFSSASEVTSSCGAGRMMTMSHGEVTGLLTLEGVLTASGGVTEFTRILFDFVSEDGRSWRYESVVSGAGFLPSPGVTARLGDSPKVWDHLVMYTSESVGTYDLLFADGYTVRNREKLAAFTYSINVEGATLSVHARLSSEDPHAKQGRLNVEYELPISALLWRKTPLGELPNLQVEAADYVKITELEKPLEGIKPSPILIQ